MKKFDIDDLPKPLSLKKHSITIILSVVLLSAKMSIGKPIHSI